ncbi:MAG: carbohydrate binding family 9 domain-containing protein [Candidatus Krumholzibacteria bacterium]|nr:carbohydrate binding family 9 domain-containing protein [Candidatus Krumholzibacteria bacterium]
MAQPSPDSTFVPNSRPVLAVRPTPDRIVIDGELDDAGWRSAARAANFCETWPGDLIRPAVDTEVLVTYDEKHLYLAFIARDDPAQIRASYRARDEIFQDDYVGIILDTYGDAAWAYELFVNPFGIQGDLRLTPSGEEIGFDVVFESRGRITEDGFQVEVAVPFKSLRFPTGEVQSWRVNFWRNHPRDSRRRYSWAAISRDDPCFLCQFGTLAGLTGVQPGGSLDLLPALVGSQAGELNDLADPTSGFSKNDPEFELSLGTRYGFTPSLGAEIALNPDFSQVESDVAQIDVNTTFALFFPERRPFFQEGSDLYGSFYDVIYTRQINDPSVAAKLTGRGQRTSFVYIFGRDDETPMILPFEERSLFAAPGKSVSNIVRARRTFGEDNWVGAVITDRRYDIGGSGTTGGVDLSWRFLQNYRVEAQALAGWTEEPDDTSLTAEQHADGATFADGKHTMALDGESYAGVAGYASVERDARHWSSDVDYWAQSATFRADAGFVTRNSEHYVSWRNVYAFYPDNRIFDQIEPGLLMWRRWNAYGLRKGQAVEPFLTLSFKAQTTFAFGWEHAQERFRGIYFDYVDLFWGELNSAFSEALSFGFWVGKGDRIARTAEPQPFLGEGEAVDVWGTLKLGRRFVLQPSFKYSTIRYPDTGEPYFRGHIWRAKFNYQFTRELFLRFILQYDDFAGELNIEPLLTYELNPFSRFYIGMNMDELDYDHESRDPAERTGDGFEPASWQVFFKFQYLFRW